MTRTLLTCLLTLACAAPAFAQTLADLRSDNPPPNGVWLDSLDLSKVKQEVADAHAGESVDGGPISLNGVIYWHGVGTHASSDMRIDLKGSATRFLAVVGVDDAQKNLGTARFHVIVDGKQEAGTPILHGGEAPQLISIDVTGAKTLRLWIDDADDGINNDHVDWAGAVLILKPGTKNHPQTMAVPEEPDPVIACPGGAQPAIHYPRVVGSTPGNPFLFLIPATGDGPLSFAAQNLPAGLTLDAKTGIISGSLQSAGKTAVKITVTGPKGSASSLLTIVGGHHQLALTPPMGWNSWNVWGDRVDAAKIRAAADAMVESGLAAHGFQYINIDDTWEGPRNASGEIHANKKFGDMKALADYVHSKGLKLGIYSSPGPRTCAGFEGSYGHEDQDAQTYAKWGIDYLKYDWCSYGDIAKGNSVADFQKPYIVMRQALDKAHRDIVYSLCQYGMGDVWKWGEQIGANCWRTTGDIRDDWSIMSDIGFGQNGHEKYAGPGHWNDPDMLVVGKVGWGNPKPSKLTPDEQVTHITLWSMLSSPLLIGCDMSQLDPFTTALLSNDEVLAVSQDALGKPAGRKAKDGPLEVWSRPLSDGTVAVALFNRGSAPAEVTARWSDIGVTGEQPARDLWQQRDLGSFNNSFTATVARHGAVLVKIGKPRQEP